MIDWTKPNGTTITTNDREATVAYCHQLGWQRVGAETPQEADDGLTVDVVNKMRKPGLKKLAEAHGIDLDPTLNVKDARCVIVNALFE